MGLVMDVLMDQVLTRKDFNGFGLFSKVPPGFQEHQAFFESYVLRAVITRLSQHIQNSGKAWCETRILTNLSRLCSQFNRVTHSYSHFGALDPGEAGVRARYVDAHSLSSK